MEVQCQTFVLSMSGGLASVEDIVDMSDPEQKAKFYQEAGLSTLAENIGPMQKAALAARNFVELSAADYELYAEFLTRSIQPRDCTIPPPDEAVTVLIAARKAQWFTSIFVRSHETTGESLLLGVVESNIGNRYFKLAQWGNHLTSVEELRKRQRFMRMLARQVNTVLAWRPRLNIKWPARRKSYSGESGAVYFGTVTLLAVCAAWTLLSTFGSWWLFAGVFTVLMIGCGQYVAAKTSHNAIARHVVGWMIGLNSVAAVVTGGLMLNTWNTKETTKEVLVCGANQREFSNKSKEWYVVTSQGHMTPIAGFYNGVYYSGNNEVAAKSLVGKWVRVTVHGRVSTGAHPPYITKADAFRSGDCG